MNSRVIGLVMAAGTSQRFGGDKRRAVLADGRTLLQATLALAQCSFSETWAVLREEDTAAGLGIPATVGILRVPAENGWNKPLGLGTSLGVAFSRLLSLDSDAKAAAVMLGDMPWVAPASCQCLAANADPDLIVRPRHAGRVGHPVLFGRKFWPRLERLKGDQGAREVLMEYPDACRFIDVDDPGIHQDIDLPQEL